jgi:hypothetical protein
MSIQPQIRKEIKVTLAKILRSKFQSYSPESKNMPFHNNLLGRDRMALFSFIQSINTILGTSIYEITAEILGKPFFRIATRQVKPNDRISSKAHEVIQKILDDLTTKRIEPNKTREIELIRSVCRAGEIIQVKPTKVDVWLESLDGQVFLIDLKTVKPNMGEFKGFKRTLLEWVAVELYRNPELKINSIIGIPYNPYEPDPYNRWTMQGMFDIGQEVLVADELWDFIGGTGTYQDLLKCFEEVGIEMRGEIDTVFKNFREGNSSMGLFS